MYSVTVGVRLPIGGNRVFFRPIPFSESKEEHFARVNQVLNNRTEQNEQKISIFPTPGSSRMGILRIRRSEGLLGVWGNKGTKEKNRREEGNMNLF